jgi:hypothetical protein
LGGTCRSIEKQLGEEMAVPLNGTELSKRGSQSPGKHALQRRKTVYCVSRGWPTAVSQSFLFPTGAQEDLRNLGNPRVA